MHTYVHGHNTYRSFFGSAALAEAIKFSEISGKVPGATHCPVAGPSDKLNAHFAVPLSQEVPFGRSLQSHSLLASGHDLGMGVSKPPHPIAQGR